MRKTIAVAAALCLLPLFVPPAVARVAEDNLFERVVQTLESRFVNKAFRPQITKIAARYRPRATAAKTLNEQRQITHEFLSNIPATHMGLMGKATLNDMMRELRGDSAPVFGFELIEYDGKHYAHAVLEGGPAERAGLRHGDRIVLIDGALPDDSERVSWRTDDAYLPDPPIRSVSGDKGEVIKLIVERDWGKTQKIDVPCEIYGTFEAAKSSVRVIEQDGRRIGYLHLWLIHFTGADKLIKDSLEGPLADCDAVIIDLRGRGGNGMVCKRIVDILAGRRADWDKPVVALINNLTRSAKEVIAYELRKQGVATLVGEQTAGAVIPASFADVGDDTVLMFPSFMLGDYTKNLEGNGVQPHVQVADAGPYSAGAEPLIDAGVREAVRLADEGFKQPHAVSADDRAVADAAAKSNATANARTASTVKPIPDDAMPTVRQILSRMVEAAGGEAAINRHTSETIKGRVDIAGQVQGDLEIRRSAPDRMLQVATLEMLGAFRSGYNGTTAWRMEPNGVAELETGKELARMRREADPQMLVNFKKHFKTIALRGKVEFAGRPCYELELRDRAGATSTFYVDAETFLEAGSIATQSMGDRDMEVTSTVEEFKEFDGVQYATRIRADVGGMQEQIITINDITFDPQDDDAFELPDEIKALLEQ